MCGVVYAASLLTVGIGGVQGFRARIRIVVRISTWPHFGRPGHISIPLGHHSAPPGTIPIPVPELSLSRERHPSVCPADYISCQPSPRGRPGCGNIPFLFIPSSQYPSHFFLRPWKRGGYILKILSAFFLLSLAALSSCASCSFSVVLLVRVFFRPCGLCFISRDIGEVGRRSG